MSADVARLDGPIRIMVADDQALIRRGMALMLSGEPDMEVVAQAVDGVEAIAFALQTQPEVILMDLHMPRKSGLVATREIMLALPRTHVLVLTTLDADEMVFEAVRAGAHAYLLKDASEAELLETIRGLRRGESWLTPQIARKVMDQFRRLAPQAGASGARPTMGAERPDPPGVTAGPKERERRITEALSEKETAILALLVEGRSNKQIAASVFLAEGTVKNYVSRIMEKLHANTRTELAVMSVRQHRPE